MLSPTPQDYLARYASHGDQAAFSALVQTQAPLVWRTAMRRLGDAQLAEEAVQNVFLSLARKSAGLATRPGLNAWLHRAAVLEASVLARSRSRREKRHLQLSLQSLADTEAAAASSAAPDSPAGLWLDEALNRLPESDRSLLLGRYFEERSYEELGGAMGKSGEAAKKQAQRALGKIGDYLRRRGLSLSSGGLASLAAAELSSAAPAVPSLLLSDGPGPSGRPEALQKLLSAAASGPVRAPPAGAALSWFHQLFAFMSTSKMTLSAAALLLLLLGTSGWQASANASLREQIQIRQAALEKQAQASASGTTAAKNKTPAAPEIPLPEPVDGATLVRIYLSTHGGGVSPLYDKAPENWFLELIQRRMRADSGEILRQIAEVGKQPCSEDLRLRIIEDLIIGELSRHDQVLAVKLAVEHHAGNLGLNYAMNFLAAAHPAEAAKIFQELLAAGSLARTRAAEGEPSSALMAGIGMGLTQSNYPSSKDATALLSFAEKIKDSGFVGDLLSGPEMPSPQLGNTIAQNAAPFLDIALRMPPGEDRKRTIAAVGRAYWDAQPDIQNWNPNHAPTPYPAVLGDPGFPADLYDAVIRSSAQNASGPQVWAALVKMAAVSPPQTREENLAWLAERFASEESGDLATVPVLADSPAQAILDQSLSATAQALSARRNPSLARNLAEKIQDPRLRTQTLQSVAP